MNTAAGIYFDGQVARGHSVTIEFVDNTLLRITGEGIAAEIALSHIRVSDRLGDVPRFLYLPNDAVIETPDNAVIDAALRERRQSRVSRLIHTLESQQRIAAVACVLVVLAIVALGFYGPPVLARLVAHRVPAEIDQRIGTAALATIRPYFRESSLTVQERERVQKQLARLLTDPALPRARLEFRSMNGGLPNAFALPGNVIIVTDELVRLPASDDEIAAVLAHELGHLEKRHGLQSLLRKSFALLIVASVTGDLSALTSFAGTIPLTILTAGYSRDLEREADRYALELLRARGINPRAFATALAKLDHAYASLQRTSTYVSTHPATEDRVALFGGLSLTDRNSLLAESSYELAAAAVRRNEHEEAVSHYDRAIQLAPTARAYTLRAQSHYARHQHGSAEADLDQALALDPDFSDAHVTRAEVLALGLKKFPEAIAAGKRALELDPKNATATATLGFAEFMHGDKMSAAATLDRAIEWDPENYRGWAYRGYLRSQTGVAGALTDYNQAITLDPKHDWLYQSRGVLLNREKNYAAALRDFAKVKNPTRWTGHLYFERGLAYHGTDKTELAIADYGQALEKGVDDLLKVHVRMNRATLLRSKGDYRSAVTDYGAALAIDPKNGDAYANRALAHRHLGQPREGLADVEKALELRHDDISLLRSRGMLHWDLGDHRAAMADFNRILDRRADLATVRARGLLYFSLADWERAEADLSSLLTGAKSRTEQYPELFRLLARRRAKKDEQRDAVVETIANWPRGWAKSIGDYLLGDLSEVRLLAEANLGKTPTPSERRCEAYFYIGQTHLLAGDHTAAEESFEKCVRTGAFHYFEYNLARAELSRLRGER